MSVPRRDARDRQTTTTHSGGFDLAGKVGLVVSYDEELGRGITDRLARAGAQVVLTLPGREPEAREIAEHLSADGTRVRALELPREEANPAALLIERVRRELGGIDLLVLHPPLLRSPAVRELAERDWSAEVLEPMTLAFRFVQEAGRAMVHQGYGGRIVLVLTPVRPHEPAHPGAGRVTHAGLEALVESFAVELARQDVTVNAVAPGLLAGPSGDEEPEAEVARIPKGRPGAASDVAGVVVFLASDEADYLTGTTVRVDGARRLR